MQNKLLFVLVCMSVTGISAQIRIEGSVKDVYGQPIKGVTIYIEGTFFETDTDKKGNYVLIIDKETYGTYNIIAEKKGYDDTFKQIKLKEGVSLKIVNLLFVNKINELNAIVIFANKSLTKVETTAIVAIDELDVLINASDANIITSLNSVAGAQQIGETGELSVRGGAGSETNYFFDGMILRNQLGTAVQNQGSNFRFSPSLFKSMELSSGGFSVEYGQSLSSILVMSSKDISQENSMNVLISPFFVDINTSSLLKKNQSLEANINLSDFGLYTSLVEPDLSYLTLSKGPKTLTGSLFYKYGINEKSFFKIFSYISSAKITSIQENINDASIKEESDIENLNSYSLASLTYDFNNKSTLNVGISYGYNQDKIITDNTFNDVLLTEGLLLKRTAKDFHSKATLKTKLISKLLINTGVEFFNQTTSFSLENDEINVTDNLVATYLEGTLNMFKNVYATAGIRYEHSSLTKNENLAPRINFSFINTGSKLKINVSYGDFYQQTNADRLLENSSLNYLKATHQILSLEKKHEDHFYKLDLFNKDYKHLIRNIDEGINTNGSGFSRGFDVLIKGKNIFDAYSYRFTYSYLDTERLFRDYPIEAPVTFTSKHKASLAVNRTFFDGDLITGITYTYNSGRPYFNPNRTILDYNQDETNDYHNLSANLIYSFKIKNMPVLLISTISNILENEQTFGYEYSDTNFDLRRPVRSLYNRFIFVGAYITFGFDKSEEFIDNIINNN